LRQAQDELFESAREFAGYAPAERREGRTEAARSYANDALTALEVLAGMKALTAETLADPAFDDLWADQRFVSLFDRVPSK
jgi:hypothetical protein